MRALCVAATRRVARLSQLIMHQLTPTLRVAVAVCKMVHAARLPNSNAACQHEDAQSGWGGTANKHSDIPCGYRNPLDHAT